MSILFPEQSAACGIGFSVNLDGQPTREIVNDILHKLACLEYRSGFNDATQENDGAGVRFYELPTSFFQQKIAQGDFGAGAGNLKLKQGEYAIGQYFMPHDSVQFSQAKTLIEEQAKALGLKLAGWRDMGKNTDPSVLSDAALKKQPRLMQAILLPVTQQAKGEFEHSLLRLSQEVLNCAEAQELDFNIVSQSSEQIVYKGMVPSSKIKPFFKDLQDESFTAKAVQVHSRFATNTNPMWKNAQPTSFFIAHNGELNSAGTNAVDMQMRSSGAKPNPILSDSIQFDRDVMNTVVRGASLEEAFTMLMAPITQNGQYPQHIKDMVAYFDLVRTGYNGPAFMVAGQGNNFVAKLDSVGLRPSRYVIQKDAKGRRQFHAYSDDDFLFREQDEREISGHLNPGGMVMVKNGVLMNELAILEDIYQKRLAMLRKERGNASLTFADLVQEQLVDFTSLKTKERPFENKKVPEKLHEKLSLSYWDHELEKEGLRYLVLNGKEQTGAMGDDTPQLERGHISQYFHQLFAQVSSPPIDSIKERDSFSLQTYLGSNLSAGVKPKQLSLNSPILREDELFKVNENGHVPVKTLSMLFDSNAADATCSMKARIADLCAEAEKFARETGGVLVLSDKDVAKGAMSVPDVIAVRAVVKHLENKGLANNVSVVADSYQIADTHQACVLLGMGACAVYPRGAYEKIRHYVANDSEFQKPENKKVLSEHLKTYHKAMEFGLLKTMGKVGITDINNYVNGRLFVALGLDMEHGKDDPQSLASIFEGINHKLTGHKIDKMAGFALMRQSKATNSPVLPLLGHFRPELDGEKHGFGAGMVVAFREWMNDEKARELHYRFEKGLAERQGSKMKDESIFSHKEGFIADDYDVTQSYDPERFKDFKTSKAFQKYAEKVVNYQKENPTSLYDLFAIKTPKDTKPLADGEVESQAELRKRMFSGSISQGAITTGDLRIPGNIRAHETILRGINAIGMQSSAGEGGENPKDLENHMATARSKQVASGRFGISIRQLQNAQEVEIKVGQGAKPGEGGQLPPHKLSIRLASQRGAIPNVELISPPPHHDIYSIEDLEQLIYDIKSANPSVKVAVKIVSSLGIGTIATGVAKAGADVINVASNSGGTGAAMQTSIKNAGLPGEIGLSEVDNALRQSGLRDRVELKASGGFKAPSDVIKAAIFGADKFEFGTIGMMTVGCIMQRTCYTSCEPGVALDADKFKGRSVDTMRFFMNIASGVQDIMRKLGVRRLEDLHGRFDLLEAATQKSADKIKYHGVDQLLQRDAKLKTPQHAFDVAKEKLTRKEDAMIARINSELQRQAALRDTSPVVIKTKVDGQDRTFGSRLAGALYRRLEKIGQQVVIKTFGQGGQSFGFVLANGMHLDHTGTVQDGTGKSMTGGILSVRTPQTSPSVPYNPAENTLGGNAQFYGASGGKGFIGGKVSHRFGVLLKGGTIVCEGAGQYACEYMTSGTALILGETDKGFGNGASGGIAITYNPGGKRAETISESLSQDKETDQEYMGVVKSLLEEHVKYTGSAKASRILANFEQEKGNFSVFVPKGLEKINDIKKLTDVLESYALRATPISPAMKVWLNQRPRVLLGNLFRERSEGALADLQSGKLSAKEIEARKTELSRHREFAYTLRDLIKNPEYAKLIEKDTIEQLEARIQSFASAIEKAEVKKSFSAANTNTLAQPKGWAKHLRPNTPVQEQRDVAERLGGITGVADYEMLEVVDAIKEYAEKVRDDASNCSGCKAQACAGVGAGTGCPSSKPINAINGKLKELGPMSKDRPLTVQQWATLREAFELQASRTPFFAFTGAACPAPCESSCTESISGAKNPVAIRNIEWNLYTLGKSLGWFEAKGKGFTDEEKKILFNGDIAYRQYLNMLGQFEPAFHKDKGKYSDEEIVIVGSGPAGLEIAHRALKDGKRVTMYEKSDKPGGLLTDGIPHHKFEKTHVDYAFEQLKNMGLTLHLNAQVGYDKEKQSFSVGDKTIFSTADQNRKIVLCTGAGKPRELSSRVTQSLDNTKRIIQAVDYLKAANDVAYELQDVPASERDKLADKLIQERFGDMDPRGKKILLIGGGDTAQDAIRWSSRYLNGNNGKIWPLVRGPEKSEMRGLLDDFPFQSDAKTVENLKRDEEIQYIGSEQQFLTVPHRMIEGEGGKMKVIVKHLRYKDYSEVSKDPSLKAIYDQMKRSQKETELDTARGENGYSTIEADMVLLAMGFDGRKENQFIKDTEHWPNVYLAGDAKQDNQWIIVGAQASATRTYDEMVGNPLEQSNVITMDNMPDNGAAVGCVSCGTCPASGGCSSEAKVREMQELPESVQEELRADMEIRMQAKMAVRTAG